jgi:hypothetical protein
VPDESNMDDLIAAIRPLAAEIVALQKQMIALGMFANDRELLECPRCDQTVHEPLTDEERDEGLQAWAVLFATASGSSSP